MPAKNTLTRAGFSLLELLIAMAILVVLASVALPAYSNYRIRAQATEFTMAIAPFKTALSEWALLHPEKSAWPANADNLGWMEYSGDYVQDISYRRASNPGIVAIVASGQVGSNQLEVFYQGHLEDGKVFWRCTARTASLQFLPKICTAEVAAGL